MIVAHCPTCGYRMNAHHDAVSKKSHLSSNRYTWYVCSQCGHSDNEPRMKRRVNRSRRVEHEETPHEPD